MPGKIPCRMRRAHESICLSRRHGLVWIITPVLRSSLLGDVAGMTITADIESKLLSQGFLFGQSPPLVVIWHVCIAHLQQNRRTVVAVSQQECLFA